MNDEAHEGSTGAHPEDAALFAPAALPTLYEGAADLAFLFSRGYAVDAAVKVVGDRYQLRERQRAAVRRSTCSSAARALRAARCLAPPAIAGRLLAVDGFNLLITLSSALRGGVVLLGQDGCVRDLAASHRLVLRTTSALDLAVAALAALAPRHVTWLFDRPVSNSARVGAEVLAASVAAGLSSDVRLVDDPDPVLTRSADPVVTSDAMILDADVPWTNVLAPLVLALSPAPFLVDLRAT